MSILTYRKIMFYLDIALVPFIVVFFPIAAHTTGNKVYYLYLGIAVAAIFRIVSYLRKERANKSS
ncbi:hypothetical protein NST38_02985 [Paenibacillus sp. FSL H8-0104]|uniref:Uncharacterized protein n=1 Tax=Paenibacillus amylolyticus TaxID=1451 RepID=A0ABD8AUA2_PAEAM|nr:hypothetical protein C161_19420 [Paenibacillus sp. FSL R5-192]